MVYVPKLLKSDFSPHHYCEINHTKIFSNLLLVYSNGYSSVLFLTFTTLDVNHLFFLVSIIPSPHFTLTFLGFFCLFFCFVLFCFVCLCFWLCCVACRISVPGSGIEPGPRQWKPGILTTRPPGNYTYLSCSLSLFHWSHPHPTSWMNICYRVLSSASVSYHSAQFWIIYPHLCFVYCLIIFCSLYIFPDL